MQHKGSGDFYNDSFPHSLHRLSGVELSLGLPAMEHHMSPSHEGMPERILIAETNKGFRESLAKRLRSSGFEVVTSMSGESAFYLLRDRMRPIDWLYSRADLPGLMDGWILADEYHDSYPDRAAVIAAAGERISVQGHVVLKEPSLAAALDAIRAVATMEKPAMPADAAEAAPKSLAA